MTTHDELLHRVIGMQLVYATSHEDGDVILVFRPVGHQYGATTITLSLAGLDAADQPSPQNERSTS